MFYISSHKGKKWGIKDTEDSVVEYHDLNYIRYCLDAGIEIKGVTCEHGEIKVSVYNINKWMELQASKIAMVTGFRLFVNPKGRLVEINVIKDEPASINLCDYCKSIGVTAFDDLIDGFRDFTICEALTFVLDDRLRDFADNCLMSFDDGTNVIFDLTAMSNENMLYNIYDQLFSVYSIQDVKEHVIDRGYRAECFYAEHCLHTPNDVYFHKYWIGLDEVPKECIDFVIRRESNYVMSLIPPISKIDKFDDNRIDFDDRHTVVFQIMKRQTDILSAITIDRYRQIVGEHDMAFWNKLRQYIEAVWLKTRGDMRYIDKIMGELR